jgi:hypothetical protein
MATAPIVDSEVATATPATEESSELVQVGNGFPPLTNTTDAPPIGADGKTESFPDFVWKENYKRTTNG